MRSAMVTAFEQRGSSMTARYQRGLMICTFSRSSLPSANVSTSCRQPVGHALFVFQTYT